MKPILLRLLIVLALAGLGVDSPAQAPIPSDIDALLQSRFKSWRPANIPNYIVSYFKERRSHEHPNFVRGDWNGDKEGDFAVLLERRSDPNTRMILVLMRSRTGFGTYFLPGDDCLMSLEKGSKDYDFETEKKFTYQNDAIFSYIWERAGSSFVWEKGRFRRILTSD